MLKSHVLNHRIMAVCRMPHGKYPKITLILCRPRRNAVRDAGETRCYISCDLRQDLRVACHPLATTFLHFLKPLLQIYAEIFARLRISFPWMPHQLFFSFSFCSPFCVLCSLLISRLVAAVTIDDSIFASLWRQGRHNVSTTHAVTS